MPLIIDDVRIKDGSIRYENPSRGQRLELGAVDIRIDDIERADKKSQLPTKFSIKASIGSTGGRINASGRADFLGDGISFELNGALTSTPITAFSSFYAGAVPFPIEAGSVAISSRVSTKDNMLTSSHHATISGLKIGGGEKEKLTNKYLLSLAGPISINASVNGDLSTGNFSFSSTLSKKIVEEILNRAVNAAPAAAASDVKKAVEAPAKKIEKGLKGVFKRR